MDVKLVESIVEGLKGVYDRTFVRTREDFYHLSKYHKETVKNGDIKPFDLQQIFKCIPSILRIIVNQASCVMKFRTDTKNSIDKNWQTVEETLYADDPFNALNMGWTDLRFEPTADTEIIIFGAGYISKKQYKKLKGKQKIIETLRKKVIKMEEKDVEEEFDGDDESEDKEE